MEIKKIKEKPQKRRVGRPKATDKKSQIALYGTVQIKQYWETMASEYGLTGSQFFEVVVKRLYSMDEFNLNDFVGLKKVSAEEQQKIIERHQNKPFKAETKPESVPIRPRQIAPEPDVKQTSMFGIVVWLIKIRIKHAVQDVLRRLKRFFKS